MIKCSRKFSESLLISKKINNLDLLQTQLNYLQGKFYKIDIIKSLIYLEESKTLFRLFLNQLDQIDSFNNKYVNQVERQFTIENIFKVHLKSPFILISLFLFLSFFILTSLKNISFHNGMIGLFLLSLLAIIILFQTISSFKKDMKEVNKIININQELLDKMRNSLQNVNGLLINYYNVTDHFLNLLKEKNRELKEQIIQIKDQTKRYESMIKEEVFNYKAIIKKYEELERSNSDISENLNKTVNSFKNNFSQFNITTRNYFSDILKLSGRILLNLMNTSIDIKNNKGNLIENIFILLKSLFKKEANSNKYLSQIIHEIFKLKEELITFLNKEEKEKYYSKSIDEVFQNVIKLSSSSTKKLKNQFKINKLISLIPLGNTVSSFYKLYQFYSSYSLDKDSSASREYLELIGEINKLSKSGFKRNLKKINSIISIYKELGKIFGNNLDRFNHFIINSNKKFYLKLLDSLKNKFLNIKNHLKDIIEV
jgi:hypothetical protein